MRVWDFSFIFRFSLSRKNLEEAKILAHVAAKSSSVYNFLASSTIKTRVQIHRNLDKKLQQDRNKRKTLSPTPFIILFSWDCFETFLNNFAFFIIAQFLFPRFLISRGMLFIKNVNYSKIFPGIIVSHTFIKTLLFCVFALLMNCHFN